VGEASQSERERGSQQLKGKGREKKNEKNEKRRARKQQKQKTTKNSVSFVSAGSNSASSPSRFASPSLSPWLPLGHCACASLGEV